MVPIDAAVQRVVLIAAVFLSGLKVGSLLFAQLCRPVKKVRCILATLVVLSFASAMRPADAAPAQGEAEKGVGVGFITSLIPAETISGRIIDPSGKSLEAVQIQVRCKGGDQGNLNVGSNLWTTTDTNGIFQANVPTTGLCEISVLPDEFTPQRISVNQKRGDLGDIKVVDGIRTTGKAVNLSGEPVAGAWVNLSPINPNPAAPTSNPNTIFRSCKTDKDGKFSLGPVESGKYFLGIHEGPRELKYRNEKPLPSNLPNVFLDQEIEISPQDVSRERLIQAVPHVNFRGQCLDLDGKPRKDRNIQVWGFVNGAFYATTHQSNESGHLLGVLPEGLKSPRYKIGLNECEAVHVRYGDIAGLVAKDEMTLSRIQKDVIDLQLFLYDSPSVYIKLFDKDGNVLHKCRVSGVYKDGPTTKLLGIEGKSIDFDFNWNSGSRFLSNQLLPNREVTLKVTADGYEPAIVDVLVPSSDEAKEIAIVMDRVVNKDEAAKATLKEKYEEIAKQHLEKIATGDKTANTQFALGTTYFVLNDVGKAQFHWYMALAIDPKHTITMNNLAMSLARSDPSQIAEALELIDRALSIENTKQPEMIDSKGEILMLAERYSDAIVVFRNLLKVTPMRISAHEKIVRCYEKLGEEESAEKERAVIQEIRGRPNSKGKSGNSR